MKVSAKWLVVLTGLISTAASLVGGLFMYVEGLRILESAVEEIGTAEVASMADQMQKRVISAEKVNVRYMEVLRGEFGRHVDTREKLQDFIADVGRAHVHHSELGHGGIGIFGADPAGPAFNNSFYNLMISSFTETEEENLNMNIVQDSEYCPYPCIRGYKMGAAYPEPAEYKFNFSTGIIRLGLAKKAELNMSVNTGFWVGPFAWRGTDGTPYSYIFRTTVMAPLPGKEFQNSQMFFFAFLTMRMIDKVVKESSGVHDRMAIVQFTKDNKVFAAKNIPMKGAARTCGWASFQECDLTIADILDDDYREIIIKLNGTGDRAFTSINGIWVIKRRIFRNEGDSSVTVDPSFDSIYLLWFRPESTINDKLNSALFLFVGFVVAVFVFDVVIGIGEIILVARPLNRLSEATGYIELLCLDTAEDVLNSTGSVRVSEVDNVKRGLLFIVSSLREYKAYLPRTLFEDDSVSSGEEKQSSSYSHSHSPTMFADRTSRTPPTSTRHSEVACPGIPTMTKLKMRSVRVASLLLRFRAFTPTPAIADLTNTFGNTISHIEQVTKLSNGALHPFLAGDCRTLLVTFPTTDKAIGSAVTLASELPVKAGYGVTVGSYFAGNMGSATYRCYSVVGCMSQVLIACHHLAFQACRLFGESCIVSPSATCRTVLDRYRTEPALILRTESESGEAAPPVIVDEVVGDACRDESNKEWMYDLEDLEHGVLLPLLGNVLEGKFVIADVDNVTVPREARLASYILKKVKKSGNEAGFYCDSHNTTVTGL
eukprot:TRINITY_DN33408_c0_g1_i1.p1 TRINITY_DN33408_c0_g1~~TRINITY_DN33408_c0_g1_i1.p1  ORF type:complete len:770 (+),score=151.66 TRINITY_DN33408_c0_g1_i1:126-2435(+)